jgi:hypothetical protein
MLPTEKLANRGFTMSPIQSKFLFDQPPAQLFPKIPLTPKDPNPVFRVDPPKQTQPLDQVLVNHYLVRMDYRVRERRPRLVPGEYYSVGRMTTQPALMVKAHTTPLSWTQCRQLIAQMCDKFGVKNLQVQYGRSRRGRGGCVRVKGQRLPYVSFPKTDNWNKGPEWQGKLRAGLILHELAHAFTDVRGHGRTFVQKLDELLVAAEGLY